MKKVLLVLCLVSLLLNNSNAQTPINLASQGSLTYTENFADINNWVFNTATSNGTFTTGIGATAWKGVDIATSTPAIPNANRITTLSNFFQVPTGTGAPIYSGGVYRGNQSMILLSTGTTDNSTSVAMDFFLDFTGINAGTLSFDWAQLNNGSTGSRTGSLRVYASTDGTIFSEITAAQVLNFANNTSVSGTVSNIALPSIFNGSATARLRFYYHNGTGGTGGSRPRLNLDNVKVTALPTTPCVAPTAQPTNFVAGTVLYNSAQFSFSAPTPAPQNYLVVMSKNNALSSNPVNNTTYNLGDNFGDGTVVAVANTTSVTVTGLTNSTVYYFFIFSMNNVCSGGPLYSGTSPLMGTVTTLAGQLPCVAPTTPPTNLVLGNITSTSITGNFTAAANTDEYLVVRSLSSNFTGTLNNGVTYNGGNVLGNGSVVTRTSGTSFTANNLSSGVPYYFYVFGINSQNCNAGPVYNSTNPLKANATTIALPTCVTPTAQPSQLNLVADNNSIQGYFIAATSTDGYLVVRSTNVNLSALPTDATTYTVGSSLGGGIVISNSSSTSFIDYNLSSGTQYYYFIFSRNTLCTGTQPIYLTTSPLKATAITTTIATNNYYYGNLHAHSSYSDGNVDNASFIPSNDYAYAKNSLCMDFLGISEHNHLMSVNNYLPGLNQAAAATTSTFLALYGMEYGVISNGGHVLIYGSNQLIGWDNNNYNIYVPKSDYIGTPESTGITGLFRTINNINNQLGNPAFASFAHPDYSDYNNLANIPYNATADSATIGCAVASGPAFSTSTTYNDPPSAMAYLDYYNRMLSKGYHIGPFMDHDSHYTNFGRSSNNRLAVMASDLTSTSFYTAMKARRFYATEDCDTRVKFTINSELMGSVATGTTPPAISVYAIDPTNPTAVPTIKIMYGVLGTGAMPVQLANGSGNGFSYTDNILAVGATGYYYADITIAGNRTITSPIWYTKTSPVPVTLLSFTASMNNNRSIQLQWKTTNEINSQKFIVEKSVNGVLFTPMTTIDAKGELAAINIYNTIDIKPNEGINYYRLQQIDKDGKATYSNVVSINLNKVDANAFSIYPNPVGNLLQLNINSTNKTLGIIVITDVSGRVVKNLNIDLSKGFQSSIINLTNLKQGNYQITLNWNNQSITQKLIKF